MEMMAIFQRLNREQGITVMFVTHEPDIAAYTRRVLRMRDGLLHIAMTAPDATARQLATAQTTDEAGRVNPE